ncbi:adenylate kinase [Methanomicrobiaceae archaeon CYW5]|uniref:adenylate kinase family protein n=1 Tax=Methanovulcanius yangii TaxID=1789227 RepID=UPI0029C9F161|nr:adenylate kinase family protein [Methanovulcanius yangii]MBT8508164.1 adenylate kinase [Methanovulcanius yangii]
MMIALSGTPGCGKSTVAAILRERGWTVVRQNETTGPYRLGDDHDRDTVVIDEELWAEEFTPFEGIIEGHLTHLLPADCVVVLRCRPDILARRLRTRGYAPEKVAENAEAEALDVILVEALEVHPESRVCEIDTTEMSPEATAGVIEAFIHGESPKPCTHVDWSAYLGITTWE